MKHRTLAVAGLAWGAWWALTAGGYGQQLMWHRNLGYCSFPAAADVNGNDRLDVIAYGGTRVFAIDGESGESLWQMDATVPVLGPAAVEDVDSDGELEAVVATTKRYVVSLSAETGKLKWAYSLRGNPSTPVTVVDSSGDGDWELLFGTQGGEVQLISGQGGKFHWRRNLKSAVVGAVPVGDLNRDGAMDAVAVTDKAYVTAMDARRGNVLWRYDAGTWCSAAPCIARVRVDDPPLVYVTGSRLVCLSGDKGRRQWESASSNEGGFGSGVVVADINHDGDAEAVAAGVDGQLYAFKAATGEPVWSTPLTDRGRITATPIVGDIDGNGGVEILLMTPDSHLFCVAGADGRVVWKRQLATRSDGAPLVANLDGDGALEMALGTLSGEFYVYKLAGRGRMVWGKFLGDGRNSGRLARAAVFGRVLRGLAE